MFDYENGNGQNRFSESERKFGQQPLKGSVDPIKKGIQGSYSNPVMDRCAKARISEGNIPIYKTPHVEMIMAITEVGENDKPDISLSASLKYINTVTRK